MKNFGLVVFAIILSVACNSREKHAGQKQSFLNGLEIHLNAIENRNLEELGPTVADDVSMISPNGDKMDSKETFMDFHKNWFEQKNWEWKGNILNTESSDSLGYALLQYKYIENDSLGKSIYESDAYLILVFRNDREGWQLVHDQNTKIIKD